MERKLTEIVLFKSKVKNLKNLTLLYMSGSETNTNKMRFGCMYINMLKKLPASILISLTQNFSACRNL